jgi:hypothetical protein
MAGPITAIIRKGGLSGFAETPAGNVPLEIYGGGLRASQVKEDFDAVPIRGGGTMPINENQEYCTNGTPTATFSAPTTGWTTVNISNQVGSLASFSTTPIVDPLWSPNMHASPVTSGTPMCWVFNVSNLGPMAECLTAWDTGGTKSLSAQALVYNTSDTLTHTYQLTRNGTPIGVPITVLPRRYGMINAVGGTQSTGQLFGITSPDLGAGEKLIVLFLSVRTSFGTRSGPMFISLPTPLVPIPYPDPGDISTVRVFNPPTPFLGTPGASSALQNASFWSLPLNPDIFTAKEGTIHMRVAWWPTATLSLAQNYLFGLFDRNKAVASADNNMWTLGVSHGTLQRSATMYIREENSQGFALDNANIAVSSVNPIPDYIPHTYSVYHDWFVMWDSSGIEVWANDNLVLSMGWSSQNPEWPWIGENPEYVFTPAAGATVIWGNPTGDPVVDTLSGISVYGTVNESVHFFNRKLTDAERSVLFDHSLSLKLNSFAIPDSATVTGLSNNLFAGDTEQISVTLFDSDLDNANLRGCNIWFTMKSPTDNETDDSAALVKCTASVGTNGIVTASGITVDNPDTGQFKAEFTVPSIPVKWDIQIEDLSGRIKTVAFGEFSPISDVTKST